MNKPSPSTAKGKGRIARPTHFNLRGYENLRVEFINASGELEYVFEFQRDVSDTPQVSFEVVKLSQTLVYEKVTAPPNRKVKYHTARISMPEGNAFEVTFTVDNAPLFIVQIEGDITEQAAWFVTYDGAGNELSALGIERKP